MATATKQYTLKGNWFFWSDIYAALKEVGSDDPWSKEEIALMRQISQVKNGLHNGFVTEDNEEELEAKVVEVTFTEKEAAMLKQANRRGAVELNFE